MEARTPAAPTAAPYLRALADAGLRESLHWNVQLQARRKAVGLIAEPRSVTTVIPPTITPQDLVAAVSRKLPLIRQAASAPEPATPGWLDWYDLIVIHTSGGKDSQTALRRVLRILAAAGVLDRVAVLHLVLDKALEDGDEPRIEWQQVPELAAEQAARGNISLSGESGWAVWNARRQGEVLTSRGQWAGLMHYARRDVDGDLLDDFATRRKRDGSPRGWATMWTRYCTSDWKTAPGQGFTEFLCQQIRTEHTLTRPVRVLQVMGFRAQESADRAARRPFAFHFGVSAEASRHVWEWLPIHQLTTQQVWADIREPGVPYHPAYDEDLSRLFSPGFADVSSPSMAVSRSAPHVQDHPARLIDPKTPSRRSRASDHQLIPRIRRRPRPSSSL
ncbi:phosphoadenosine phosphosulfate reductase domain-containing protein [Catenuloplanes atrovinosus]|uniref:3'-phosphoadenosine 5'-phosphosulfate sulfotransferase (PAPS reductase)/FAD synthetase n=1 Tax=Catenuloplanes atrovinosus TaxID=137266 RepID=A0AAE3YSL9_9ACTN|nr:phosphoadenosine phosphosulfate reductase family protein [Catenuloplanes atrovinosus]MDR7277614.1 3'-phosphoadenosine 5'-phosphosulfate sulfotransferase (PAPS reductase)/FAD synthetase [Catenuloplanes atrovinosus]